MFIWNKLTKWKGRKIKVWSHWAGTKFVCTVSDENLNIIDKISILTSISKETMNEVINIFLINSN